MPPKCPQGICSRAGASSAYVSWFSLGRSIDSLALPRFGLPISSCDFLPADSHFFSEMKNCLSQESIRFGLITAAKEILWCCTLS